MPNNSALYSDVEHQQSLDRRRTGPISSQWSGGS